MKIAVVIGHHEKSKGAFSKYFGLKEFDFYKKVVSDLKGLGLTFFTHDHNIGGYTSRIKNTASKINKSDFDLVIKLHFNSAVHPSANGCETLYFFRSKKGREYAKKFSETVNRWTGIKLRHGGLKALTNKKDRGFASVYYPSPPTILIEPFFGSNNSDCEKIKSPENLACIIKDFVKNIQ